VTSPFRFRLPRVIVAALAVLGLLGSTVRPLLACTMAAPEPRVEALAADAHAADAHAAHHGDHSAPTDADTSAPAHERCPDLAHCAVPAWTPETPALPTGAVRLAVRVRGPESRPVSVGRPIDTPPPKRV
jgi:hypothetical protein